MSSDLAIYVANYTSIVLAPASVARLLSSTVTASSTEALISEKAIPQCDVDLSWLPVVQLPEATLDKLPVDANLKVLSGLQDLSEVVVQNIVSCLLGSSPNEHVHFGPAGRSPFTGGIEKPPTCPFVPTLS